MAHRSARPVKDCAPVARAGGVSNVMIVPPNDPARTVADVIARAKARPGAPNFSSGGSGTSHHPSGVLFGRMTGTELVHAPYKGAPPEIVSQLNREVARILALPEIRERLAARGFDLAPNPSSEAFAKLLAEELGTRVPVVRASGAKV